MADTRYDSAGDRQHHDLSGDDPATGGPSTLDMLRAAADQEAAALAEEEEREPIVLYSPGKTIRLVCEHIHAQKQIQSAQRAALPKAERRKAQPSLLQMDITAVHARLISEQALRVELLRDSDGAYATVTGTDNEPLDFTDPQLLTSFGTADALAAVRRIFVRDNFLLQAGQQLLDESGWGDALGEGDEDDPPALSRRERRSSTG